MHFLFLSSLTQLLSNEVHDWKKLLVTLFIGAAGGFLAQLLTPGKGYGAIITILIGMAGGWLGSILFRKYLALTDNVLLNHIIYATAGAFIITLIFNLIVGNDEKDSTAWKA
jgi:uncharacterized membrane protein YeaQ/YmgE (transglycosylase-associated protein family)